MRSLLITTTLFTFACIDADDDGLGLIGEKRAGSDPKVADSDGDGLSDGDEKEYETDPTNPDSDGDGYSDGEEVDAGSDPTDDKDLIYIGGWPYNANKGSMDIPTSADTDLGSGFIGISLLDQFGDTVNLYDFAGQGKPILIDVSAMWCPPCKGLASWLSGQGDSYGFGDSYPNVAEMVEHGDVYWLTILGENNRQNVPELVDLQEWYADYPDPNIPVFADDASNTIASEYLMGGWPTTILFDENFKIISLPDNEDRNGDNQPDNFWLPLEDLNALGN